MQKQGQFLGMLIDYTISGYIDFELGDHDSLEKYIRENKIPQSTFQQAYAECLQQIRDSEEHLQCIKQLLKQQIDFNLKDKQGYTPLMLAIKCGNISVVKLFLEQRERLEMNKQNLKQALDTAIESNQDNWDIVEMLLSIVEPEKPQHLIKSLFKGNIKISSKLIEKGGASGQDDNGDTSLHVSAKLGYGELIKQICKEDGFLMFKKNKLNQLAKDVSINEEIKNILEYEEEQFKIKSPNKKNKQFEEITEILRSYSNKETQTEEKQEQQQQIIIKEDKSQQTNEIQMNQQSFSQSLQLDKPFIENRQSLETIVVQLTFEINSFGQEIQKYQNDQKGLIEKLIQMMNEGIKQVLPLGKVSVYGSCSTQLFLLDSDIDLVVENPKNEDMIISLYKLGDLFKYKNFISETRVIEGARFPVLKLKCNGEYDHKMIDITISNQSHNGLLTAHTLIEFQKEFKQLKYLALILKHYFKTINLLNSYQGGLNSYGLLIMIIALLQMKRVEDKEDQAIGQTFIDFFQLYGLELDYYGKRINIVPPISMNYQIDGPNLYQDLLTQRHTEQQLYIIDLHNPENNVARTTFKVKQIKHALALGFGAILNAKKCEIPCYFSPFNRPVCCILKQVIQQSKNYCIDIQDNNTQPYYYLFNHYGQQYITQN